MTDDEFIAKVQELLPKAGIEISVDSTGYKSYCVEYKGFKNYLTEVTLNPESLDVLIKVAAMKPQHLNKQEVANN